MAGSVIELLGKGSCENRLKPVCDWLHQQMTSSVLGSRDMYDMYIWSISTDIYIIYIYIFFLYPNAPLLMWRPPIFPTQPAISRPAWAGPGGGVGTCIETKMGKTSFANACLMLYAFFGVFAFFGGHVHEHVFHG